MSSATKDSNELEHRSWLVVVAELDNVQGVSLHFVYDSVLVVDAPRPGSRQIVSEWLGIADSLDRGTLNVPYQDIDALQYPAVRPLPVQVLLPGILGEDNLHSIRSRTVPPPERSSANDCRSRRA